MDKLQMQTKNIADENFKKLSEMFPNAVTETLNEDGEVVRAIDADVLREEISCKVVEGKDERYQFTWPDKKKAVYLANETINKTLRPCYEKSVDFDSTENIYIEGDNLETLKVLQETYLEKIKMIYIDPPYNTGNDFIYEDSFVIPLDSYLDNSGQFDEEGNRLVQNTDGNGRFHTDWLNMMYARLKLSKNLLSRDGVIFLSIGQDELTNLIKLCDEVFGEKNRLGIISHQMKTGGGTQGKYFAHNVDYILVYSKEYDLPKYFRGEMSEELIKKVYNQVQMDGDRKGEFYRTMGLYQSSLGVRPSLRYYIECPDGSMVIPPGENFPSDIKEGVTVHPTNNDGVWRWSYEKYKEELNAGNVEFKESKQGVLLDEHGNKSKWNVYTKIWLKDRQDEGTIPSDLLTKFENRHSSKELSELDIPFDFAKPVGLIKYLMKLMCLEDGDYILDFFSGSATTAQAVMELNSETDSKIRYIMVQIPEECDEKSKAFSKGYKNICEIGEDRIRKAGNNIRIGSPNIDYGFRVFRLDTSNMKDVYYKPAETQQMQIDLFADNIKDDRTAEDLLFQVMLDLGVLLSSKIEKFEIAGKKVFNVADGFLIACFDKNVTDETIKAVANMKPYYAVFRDSSMENDSVATNFDQIFANISPNTIRKVL